MSEIRSAISGSGEPLAVQHGQLCTPSHGGTAGCNSNNMSEVWIGHGPLTMLLASALQASSACSAPQSVTVLLEVSCCSKHFASPCKLRIMAACIFLRVFSGSCLNACCTWAAAKICVPHQQASDLGSPHFDVHSSRIAVELWHCTCMYVMYGS